MKMRLNRTKPPTVEESPDGVDVKLREPAREGYVLRSLRGEVYGGHVCVFFCGGGGSRRC